jgi:hypothetical protein
MGGLVAADAESCESRLAPRLLAEALGASDFHFTPSPCVRNLNEAVHDFRVFTPGRELAPQIPESRRTVRKVEPIAILHKPIAD